MKQKQRQRLNIFITRSRSNKHLSSTFCPYRPTKTHDRHTSRTIKRYTSREWTIIKSKWTYIGVQTTKRNTSLCTSTRKGTKNPAIDEYSTVIKQQLYPMEQHRTIHQKIKQNTRTTNITVGSNTRLQTVWTQVSTRPYEHLPSQKQSLPHI